MSLSFFVALTFDFSMVVGVVSFVVVSCVVVHRPSSIFSKMKMGVNFVVFSLTLSHLLSFLLTFVLNFELRFPPKNIG